MSAVVVPVPSLNPYAAAKLGDVAGPVTVPPVAETERAIPEADAAEALPTPIDVDVTLEAVVKFTIATTPFAMVDAVRPYAMQVYVPELPAQAKDLPAAVAAGPAVAERERTFAAG